MSKETEQPKFEGDPAEHASDTTGRKRMGRNLVSLWAVEIVVVISGFVTPRLIDEQLGQSQLGIWDLGWSIVSYFRFLGIGMAGGLNRYVAVYKASNEHDRLGEFVSSFVAFQAILSTLMVAFTLGAAVLAPRLVGPEHGDLVEPIRWVVVFLGATLAARMFGSSARGLLTGQHLWTHNSAVQMAGDIGSLVVMVIVLLLGGGLRELAGSYFLASFATEFTRFVVARRCYGRRLFDRSEVRLRAIGEMFKFSVKTNAGVLPSIIVIQTLNIILASAAGPAALAVYARALALQHHAAVVISSFTKLLTPTAASLQGLGRVSAYKSFFLESMRMSFALSLPVYILLAAHGDYLLLIWMGSDYIRPWLLIVVCAGMLFPTTNTAAFRILAGLNQHGRAGIVAFSVTSLLLGGSLFLLMLNNVEWSALVAGATLGICLTFGSSIPMTMIACYRFSVGFWEFLRTVLVWPLLANLPFAVILFGGSRWIDRFAFWDVFFLVLGAGVVLVFCYWFILLSAQERQQLLGRIRKRGAGSGPAVRAAEPAGSAD